MAAQRRGGGEGLGPPAERFVGGDGHTGLFLPFRQNLEQELGAAAVEFHVAELIDLCDIAPRWNIGPVATGPMFHRADGGHPRAGVSTTPVRVRAWRAARPARRPADHTAPPHAPPRPHPV